jgi:uncharacterized protein YijF (DUF1287 family)
MRPIRVKISGGGLSQQRWNPRIILSVRYVSAYIRIPSPGGDVPADAGVCTDEIIRSYRAVGVDLQKEVHEDMHAEFCFLPQ